LVIAWKNSSKQNLISESDMSARSSLIMHISVDGKDKKKYHSGLLVSYFCCWNNGTIMYSDKTNTNTK